MAHTEDNRVFGSKNKARIETIDGNTFRIIREPKYFTYQQWVVGGIKPQTAGERADDHWRDVGYYGKLSDLVIYLVNNHIEVPEGTLQTQIGELLTEIKRVEKSILEALTSLF